MLGIFLSDFSSMPQVETDIMPRGILLPKFKFPMFQARDKDWGGYIWTTVNVWPAVNDSCQGVMEVFANALPYYGSRTLTIN